LAAIRLGQELNAKPVLQQCLVELARLELDAGNDHRARRLVQRVTSDDLAGRQGEYGPLLEQLTPGPETAWDENDPDAVLGELFREQELRSLLL
jgi:hypothetical protein